MDYKKELKIFNLNKIALLSILLFALCFVAGALVNLLAFRRPLLLTDKVYWDIIITLAIMAVGVIAHEGLHALGAMIFGKCKKENISFGFIPRQLMFYCHAEAPMKASAYKTMLLLPVIITGFIPFVLSVCLGNIFLVVAFAMLISGGAGDLIMAASLRKIPASALLLDHPKAPAYYLLYKSDALPENFNEVTPEQEEALLKSMREKPLSDSSRGRNNLLKILAIFIFLAFVVTVVFLIALLMKLF